MHTPARLVACPTCACHHRAEEAGCPHCGSTSAGRPAAALMLGLALLGGCGKSVAMYGTPITGPSIDAEITAPATGEDLSPGDVTFDATVYATEIGDLTTLDVAWSVDEVAACDDAVVSDAGETSCVVPLTAGDHDVTVQVTDPESGSTGGETLRVTVGTGG